MSLATNISDAFTRVATELKSLRTLINGNQADLSALTTSAKGNLVAAINELASAAAGASGIDDSSTGSSSTWSSSKIEAAIEALINDAASGTTNTWSASYIGAQIASLINDAAASTDATHTFSAQHILALLTALINDTGTSTTAAWSSSKTAAQIAALISDAGSGSSVLTWSQSKIASYVTTALGGYTQINDATTGTTSVWSSQKVSDSINAAITALVNGAPTALDTLKEIADKLAADDSSIGAILTGLDNRVRVDAAQSFTTAQQAQGRANVGAASDAAVGDTTTDFVAAFNAALA